MREVFAELSNENALSAGFFDIGWEKMLRLKVWEKFRVEQRKGNTKIKVLFFSVDAAPLIERLLEKWFGPELPAS